MKKILVLLCIPMLAALAGEHASLTLRASLISTNASSIVTNAIPVTGKIVSLSAVGTGGSATVTVYTVSGLGSSLGAAKTVQAATVVTAGGVVTNYAAPSFLGSDYIVARFDNATATSSVSPVVTIIYEK